MARKKKELPKEEDKNVGVKKEEDILLISATKLKMFSYFKVKFH
jgi:hypothetical protein